MARLRVFSTALALPLFFSPALFAQTLHSHAEPAEPVATASAPAATPAPSTPAPSVQAQLSVEGYEHLLNVLFPADHAVKPGLDYTLVLRFEPHLHPESQVVIHRYHSGKVEGSFDRVLEGNAWRAAYQSGEDLSNTQYESVAKTIPVRRSAFTLTDAEVQGWHNELFPLLSQGFHRVRTESKQIQRSGTWKVMANGTRYELWLIQGDDEVHLVSWDSEVEPTPNGSTGIVRWMNTIRWQASGHTLAPVAPVQAPAAPVQTVVTEAKPAPAVVTEGQMNIAPNQ